MNRPLVIAHRGYSSRYVENTQSAYQGAIDIGADIVESDARLTRDGRVYACHDADLARIAANGDARALADLDAAALDAVVLLRNERLSPLPLTLARISPRRPVLIDVKTPDQPLIEAVVRDVMAADAVDRVWVGVRDVAQLRRALMLAPRLKMLAFLPDYARADEFEQAGAQAFRVWEGEAAQPAAARVLRDKPTWITMGGKGTPCEVGDTTPSRLARILDLLPRGVLVNDPALLLAPGGASPSSTSHSS
ncbi:glycerophosphodiester phosphodiesterase [Achromobacter aloeverae]|uniref:GP-PDE domain-containing protein n=1 Tax=Achromobacter aloeverae TaxID=1750518 RepID=A0A4Q1HKA1_9BURK|nr:glycerophosphodiester phosphodiesterase [Achromobacter aloeverae]RXN88066.1 hypothetical protein C7R54_15965 [Achromobacter aloeverae]